MEKTELKLKDVIKILNSMDQQLSSEKRNPVVKAEAIDLIVTIIHSKQDFFPAAIKYVTASQKQGELLKASEMRKFKFLQHYLNEGYNAVAAARYAGFKDSKSLKQQAHRVYKEIQSILRRGQITESPQS